MNATSHRLYDLYCGAWRPGHREEATENNTLDQRLIDSDAEFSVIDYQDEQQHALERLRARTAEGRIAPPLQIRSLLCRYLDDASKFC